VLRRRSHFMQYICAFVIIIHIVLRRVVNVQTINFAERDIQFLGFGLAKADFASLVRKTSLQSESELVLAS
jgi:hypothetical protein